MKAVRNMAQHVFNPLHVFCRLRQAGMNDRAARFVCRVYETCLYRIVFPV